MKVYNFNNKILESWWALLNNLSNEIKLELASRLIDSLKKETPKKPTVNNEWRSLFGAWKEDEMPTEELINLIRDSRISNHSIESLD